MKKLKIGIPAREIIEDNVLKNFINLDYLKAVDSYDLIPIMIPYDINSLDFYLELCDCFLIPGGDDMDPKYYHEENLSSHIINPKIDELDYKIFNYAVKEKKPLFGICRGFQDINVYLGGTLYQDIKNHINVRHEIITYNHFLNDKIIEVTSYHHQAIKDLASDLIILAKSKDGFVEAFKHKELPIFAVQFHPEKSFSKDGHLSFDYFYNEYLKKIRE